MRTIAAFLSLTLLSLAQSPAPNSAPAKGGYSQESFVIEQTATDVSFEDSGTGSVTNTVRLGIKSEGGVQALGLLAESYEGWNESLEFRYVRVRKPTGEVIETPQTDVQDLSSEITRQAPEYTDLREKHVAVKGLAVGDTLEYQTIRKITKAIAPSQFWWVYAFEKQNICLDESVALHVPAKRQVIVKSSEIQPVITEAQGIRTYTWHSSNVKRKTKEELEAAAEDPPSIQVTSFRSWKEVADWYAGLEADRMEISPEMKAKAAALTSAATTPEQKVRAIYDFVSRQFRYIGLSLGIGRYQPHSAISVFSNGYGDCKDKHTLLAAMLRSVGIEAVPALISSSRDPEDDVPYPSQFDHLITYLPGLNGGTWLDSTPELAPFGLLLGEMRGREALVVTEGKLVSTPAKPPFSTFEEFTATAKLDDKGVLTADMQRRVRGDAEVLLRLALRRVPRAQWPELVQSLSYGSGFGGKVSQVETSSPEDTSSALVITYHYVREDYADWDNRRILAPLPPTFTLNLPEDVKPRKPLPLVSPEHVLYISTMQLPAGAHPQAPEETKISNEILDYDNQATFTKDGVFKDRRELTVHANKVPLNKVEELRKTAKDISSAEYTYIPLFPSNNPWDTLGQTGDEKADRLFNDAREAFTQRDVYSAMQKLLTLRDINSKYPGLWTFLGITQLASGKMEEGLRSMEKEVEVNPANTLGERTIATTLEQMRRGDEALPYWKKLLEVQPNAGDAALRVAQADTDEKQYLKAISVLKAAAQANPDDFQLQMRLGSNYALSGDEKDALEVLKSAIKKDGSPSRLNEAAWALAEASVATSQALEWAKASVEAEEAESAKLSIGEIKDSDVQSVNDLGAAWDTLGWIYYETGDYDSAAKYLNASWQLLQDGRVAEHLVALLRKQGKTAAALKMQKLGASAPQNPIGGSKKGYSITTTHFTPGQKAPYEELQDLRTMKLPKRLAKDGSGEYLLLFDSGGNNEAKAVHDGEGVAGAEAALQTLNTQFAWPDSAHVKLLRRGILNCSEVSGCQFVLLLPANVRSVH